MLVNALVNFGLLSVAALALLATGLASSKTLNTRFHWLPIGLVFGLASVLVINVPITIPPGMTFDTRAGPVVLSGFLGGPWSALVCSVIAGAARWYVGGPAALGGVAGMFVYGLVGTVAGHIIFKRLKRDARLLDFAGMAVAACVAVVPVFFIGFTVEQTFDNLRRAWPLLVAGNTVGIFGLGVICEHLRRYQNLHLSNLQSIRNSDLACEAAGVAIWRYNFGTDELWWDKRMFAMYGVAPTDTAQLTMQDWIDPVHPDDLQATLALFEQCKQTGEPFVTEFRVVMPDGEIRWLNAHAQFHEEQGNIIAVGVNSDITEARELREQVMIERDKAQEANKAKSRFLGRMSHELRTPLNAIIGYTDFMLSEAGKDLPREAVDKHLADVNFSGTHLLSMINDLLDLVQIESDRVTLAAEPCSARKKIGDALRMVRPLAQERNMRLSVNVPRDLPDMLADRRAVHQVLLNLMSNAAKYAPVGTCITIEAEDCSGNGKICLAVRDEGAGIPQNIIDQIGQPLQLNDKNYESSKASAGLGLSITKQLIDRMGGELIIKSAEGQGAMVIVRLPAVEQANGAVCHDEQAENLAA